MFYILFWSIIVQYVEIGQSIVFGSIINVSRFIWKFSLKIFVG